MSYKDFVNLKSNNLGHGSEDDDQASVDDETVTLINSEAPPPTNVMYIPQEGRFSNETSTLIDGQGGESSSSAAGFGSSHRKRSLGLNTTIQQLHYNDNKIALDRSINQTIDLIYEISQENKERPIFYPTDVEDDNNVLLNSKRAHLALVRNNSSALKAIEKSSLKDNDQDLPEFKILKLNLKIGNNNHSSDNLVSNLDKKAIATLLEKKFGQLVKYLLNLKDRIDDTTSKVFVTGDLNAGKSTFCNALLRRKVLPEDQQPCTSVFCEVIDASKENNGIEEVHAIPIGKEYNIRDESSYQIHPLKKLEDLVYECDSYSLLKVYVLDQRSLEESLLHNGVIDIKLIDAPGLNMDSFQTTQVFSRQEEIDLVVFVVNSENHFTLSAKEFISTAAAEKRYVFIVVNRFDNIKDKEKCKAKILDQVKSLSPDTYKNAKDFIHFVSSSEIVDKLPSEGDDGPGSGDDDPEGPNDPDFDQLEASLRKFILDKRSISKLLPAKSYIINLLHDLQTLSEINQTIYKTEVSEKTQILNQQVAPKYNEMISKSNKVSELINGIIENTAGDLYETIKKNINTTVLELGDKPIIKYQGLQSIYEYARGTQQMMIKKIISEVETNEALVIKTTEDKVKDITKLGQQTLGEEFLHDKVFKSELMFTRKRDTVENQLDSAVDVFDFFDPSLDSCLLWLGLPKEYIPNTKTQIGYFNPLSVVSTVNKQVQSLRTQSIPSQLSLQLLYSSGKILTTGALIRKLYDYGYLLNLNVLKKVGIPIVIGVSGFAVYYLISDIPNAYPRKQAKKLKSHIENMDFAHNNASRMVKECRQVLNYPARQVLNNFQTSIDKRISEKSDLESSIKDAEISFKYFHELQKKIGYQRGLLDEIDLESVNTVD
ncbi:hypothetical protein DFJ63DRAFT_313788 [Scheffersomyces coipomensis]|uniref:uncharacterized protein n=1 Tax=Scheffersomyces coipomensis TaxID=1788519 RepID=UPI00315D5CEC